MQPCLQDAGVEANLGKWSLGPHPPIPPSQILALILVRRLLDFVFSQHDLAWIDNIIPEKEKKKEDDKKKKKKGNKGDSSSDEEVCS